MVFPQLYSTEHGTEQHSEHYSQIPKCEPICPSSKAEYVLKSESELQLQCRYCTRCTRLIFGRARMFIEGVPNAGFQTTPTTYNYSTGSTETEYSETHSPIEMFKQTYLLMNKEPAHPGSNPKCDPNSVSVI
jgi:hypothetical protein